MIPKIIHYCWFGKGKKSELISHCIESWERNLPDYKIIEWNEDNFNVNICKFTKQAYENKKWAFVSDYARLYALFETGGIYLDTDVEVFQSFDAFLDTDFLVGFESNDMIGTAVIGASKENKLISELIEAYNSKMFIKEDGSFNQLPNPYVISPMVKQNGVVLNGKKQRNHLISVYPQKFFFPNSLSMVFGKIPQSCICVHHTDQSWVKDKKNSASIFQKIRRYNIGVLRNLLGTENTYNLKQKVISIVHKKD